VRSPPPPARQAFDERALARHIADSALFAHLDEAARRDLAVLSDVYHLDDRELLYVAGEPARHVFVVLSGVLQIEYPPPGRTRGYAVAVLPAPFVLGECQALNELPWSGTGVALTPLVALVITPRALEGLMLEHPALGWAFYRELVGRFLDVIESRKTQLQATPPETLARYLTRYISAIRSVNDAPSDLIRVRQQDLGRATGLRRETVNRILRGWTQEGYLRVEPRGLAGVDLGRLEALVTEQKKPTARQRGSARKR
jgi:CRP/FNR family transcriptional regulator